MMALVPGVISLLDPPATARVEALCQEMTERFGVGRGFPGGIPHLTFHISNRDIEPGAIAVVERVASEFPPFTLFSSGLGTFAGPDGPIVHIAVARAPRAASLAETLDRELAAAGYPGTDRYYTPERWVPHITIAQQNLDGVDLGKLLAWLAAQPLAFELPLTSLSVAKETPTGADILATFPLGG